MTKKEILICGLCEREVNSVSRHHLIPREEGGKYGPTVNLCQPCHSSIHTFLSNRELAKNYNTIPALQAAEPLQKYLKWIRTKNINRISNRNKQR